MTVGSIIKASDYNIIQSKIGNVLGNGTTQLGYGQVLNSSQVPITKIIDASDMANVRLDAIKAHAHQTGSLPTMPNVTIGQEIPYSVYNTYSSVADTIFTNKNLIDVATQASVENKLSSSRATAWGGESLVQTLVHEFTVSFNTTDARRHFFNAGGEIRLSAIITGGTGAKTTSWLDMFTAMSIIKFSYSGTTASSGAGSAIGNFDLTTTYQDIYIKNGTNSYSDNQYKLSAKVDSTSKIITFRVEMNDGVNNFYDESVTGTLTSSIAQLRPTGIYVEVPSPVYANLITIS